MAYTYNNRHSDYFDALQYGAFLMSFGVALVHFAKMDENRSVFTYQVSAVVMCLLAALSAFLVNFAYRFKPSRVRWLYHVLTLVQTTVALTVSFAVIMDIYYDYSDGHRLKPTTRVQLMLAYLCAGYLTMYALYRRGTGGGVGGLSR